MMSIFRNFFRHLREGFRNLFRNGWMTTASIFTMTLSLMMVGGLSLLLLNLQKLTQDIESSIQIRVMIDVAANQVDEQALRASIEKIDHVEAVTYRTKDEELQALIENVGEEFSLHEGDANPLSNVFVVDVDNPDNISQVAQTIEGLTYVSNVNYGALVADNLFKQIDVARYIFAVVAAVLVVSSVLLVSNTIRLTIFARQSEINIMRLVGAKNGYIRAPFSVEGALIGIISALLATGLLYWFYETVRVIPSQVYGLVNVQFLVSLPLFYYLGGCLIIVGILLGAIGARRSMNHFLKI